MKKTLIGLFILIVCIPMLFSFMYVSDMVSERMEKMMEKRAANRLLIAENILQQTSSDLLVKAKTISQLNDIKELVSARDLIQLIDRLHSLRKDFRLDIFEGSIEIFDAQGNLLVSEPANPKVLSDQSSVIKALAGNFSETRKYASGKLTISSVVPLYHPELSSPLGVVAVSLVVTESFVDEIKRITDTDVVILSDYNGDISVLATTVMQNGQRFFPVMPGLGNSTRVVDVGARRFLVKASNYKAINSRFVLAIALEKRDLLEMLSTIRDMLLWIGLGAVLFALFLAFFFSKSLTNPIYALVEAATNLGTGDLEKKVDIGFAVEEFQFLGKTFDSMRLQVKGKLEELEKTNKSLDRKVFDLSVRNLINQAIISKNEDSVLRELLQIIVNTMGAERSSMLLLDPQTDRLALKVVVFKDGTFIPAEKAGPDGKGISFELGEGIAGHVAKTGIPMIVNDPANDARFKPYEGQSKVSLKNLVTVPLRGENETLGVVNLSDRLEDFTDEDKNLLQGIADQIAIALQKARLYEMAITDGMTGLFIHRYFQMRLEAELSRARRNDEKLSLLMFDIDHFKKFNDTYGHQLGDKVIKMVAATIKHSVRDQIDIPARYGGEEFAVIMPNTDIEGAAIFAERLRKAVESTLIPYKDEPLKVTVSLGCAMYPDNAAEKDGLIKCADKALYRSKEKGRNMVSISTAKVV